MLVFVSLTKNDLEMVTVSVDTAGTLINDDCGCDCDWDRIGDGIGDEIGDEILCDAMLYNEKKML